ncbi:MAG: hypothetical protein FJZ59_07350 [Chlamydiae bacterium]|nr:hypothetical protein [Chlamydiota bacterium]
MAIDGNRLTSVLPNSAPVLHSDPSDPSVVVKVANSALKRIREDQGEDPIAKRRSISFNDQVKPVLVDKWMQKPVLLKKVEALFNAYSLGKISESLCNWKDFFARLSENELRDVLENLEFPNLNVFCLAYDELIRQVEKTDFLGNKVIEVKTFLDPKVQAMFRSSFFTEMVQKGIKENSFQNKEEFRARLHILFKDQFSPSSTLNGDNRIEKFLEEFDPSSYEFWEEFFLHPVGIINHGLLLKGADQSLNWKAFERSIQKLGISSDVFLKIKQTIQFDEKRVVMDLTEAMGHLLIGQKAHISFNSDGFMEYVTQGVENFIGSLQKDLSGSPFIDTKATQSNEDSLRRGISLYKRLKGSFERDLKNPTAPEAIKEACGSLIRDCDEVLKKFV